MPFNFYLKLNPSLKTSDTVSDAHEANQTLLIYIGMSDRQDDYRYRSAGERIRCDISQIGDEVVEMFRFFLVPCDCDSLSSLSQALLSYQSVSIASYQHNESRQ
jgi:hypothetical protein